MKRTGNFRKAVLALAVTSSPLAFATPASAQLEPYIGQIMQVGFNFCPRGWVSASGQLMSIAQNTALFSLLGTNYGGNGTNTFALPDFRGRTAINDGQGPGLTPYVIGETTGTESHSLLTTEMPSHTHRTAIQTANADNTSKVTTASGNAFGVSTNASYLGGTDPTGNLMNPGTVQFQPTGNGIPFSTRPPYLTVQWCIATQGIFPQRN